jgi:hypothetical protein
LKNVIPVQMLIGVDSLWFVVTVWLDDKSIVRVNVPKNLNKLELRVYAKKIYLALSLE